MTNAPFFVYTHCSTMEFEWDEAKRASNLEKHGFDFVAVGELFAGPHVVIPSRHTGAEPRSLAVGKIQGRFATAVFTIRGGRYRIISLRSARDEERATYRKLHG